MKIKDSYPVIVTNQLAITKNYYLTWLGFESYFESTWFILMQSQGEKPFFIALMDETHPTSPPSMPAVNSNCGVFLTLEVEDAKTSYEQLSNAGLDIYYPLKDEIWGQKRFGLIDPNGMYIDIVEQTVPQDGFWDQFMINAR